MKREDVIRLAKEAGFEIRPFRSPPIIAAKHSNGSWISLNGVVERFAALVAAAERDRCANECEEYTATMSMMANRETCRAHNQAVKMCVVAIRALGGE